VPVDLRRLGAAAPIVYLLTALPVVLLLSFLTPPFQVPDEGSHFRRAVHILGGGIIGKRVSDTMIGGAITAAAVDVDAPTYPLLGHPERRVDPAMIAAMRGARWSQERRFQAFGASVIYPPAFYLPAVAGLALGRALDLTLVDSASVARAVNGVLVVVLGTLALAAARRSRPLLFVVLSLPASLYLAAGITQDGMLLASVVLAAALVCRAAAEGGQLSSVKRLAVGVLLGTAVAARLPYAPLLALLLTRPFRGAGLRGMAPFAVAMLIASAWIAFGLIPMLAPYRADEGVSPPGQIAFLLEHPGSWLRIALDTLSAHGARHLREFVGILGWGDAPLPAAAYWLAAIAVATASAIAACGESGTLGRGDRAMLAGAALCSGGAIYGALYLTWTAVGAPAVEGVQGRYFLPLAAMLSIAVPALTRLPPAVRTQRAAVAGWVLLFTLAVANSCMVPYVVYARFYG
jgi:uncharacterized membrane protein